MRKGPPAAVLPNSWTKGTKAEAAVRKTEQDVLFKVLSNGRSDYIRRVLQNVRDRQLKLLTTERPDWRDGEQLSRRDWQLRLLKKERPDWRVRE